MTTVNDWGVDEPISEANGGTSESTYVKGDILYASASNTLSKLAIGTDNHVLKLSGGVPAWAAASGGSGDWVPLAQTTASSSASLNFDNTIITSTYAVYAFIIFAYDPATTATDLYIRLSPDNGSTIRSTGYDSTNWEMGSTSRNDTTTQILVNNGTIDSTDGYLQAFFYMANASDSGTKTVINGYAGWSTGTEENSGWFQGMYDTAETHNYIQFLSSSGNINAGTIYCYGVNAS